MKINISIIILSLLLLNSCNCVFFVSKDDVILREEGYFLIPYQSKEYEFIPCKIDTGLTLSENLKRHKLGKGIYFGGLRRYYTRYLELFGDTIRKPWYIIVPVELEYRRYGEGKSIENEVKSHFIVVDKVKYDYEIRKEEVRYIDANPLVSFEKKYSIELPPDWHEYINE